jgi:hypothetical protein
VRPYTPPLEKETSSTFQDKETKASLERRNTRVDETDERENRLTIMPDTAEKITEGNEI